MAGTFINGRQIEDGTVSRVDLNTTVTGNAVIRKVISGTEGILLGTSTGIDAGTGDVSLKADLSYFDTQYQNKNVAQGQNMVWAGPVSGTGPPTFRALTIGDIPALPTPSLQAVRDVNRYITVYAHGVGESAVVFGEAVGNTSMSFYPTSANNWAWQTFDGLGGYGGNIHLQPSGYGQAFYKGSEILTAATEADPIYTADKPYLFKTFSAISTSDAALPSVLTGLDYGTYSYATETTGGIINTFKDKSTTNWGFQIQGELFNNNLFYRGQNGNGTTPNNYRSWRTFAFQDWVTSVLPTVNNGTLTIAGGSGISGSTTFTANQASNSSITLTPTYGTTAGTIAQGNDSRFHNPVTIGTANGLSLSTQVLSLAAANTSTTGALTSTDWNTFNNKQAALSGTGVLSFAGTTPSYSAGTANQILRRNAANTAYEFFTPTWTSNTGTVTNFSAGALSPLFTTSVATSTTTPALTFAFTAAGANTWFGNAGASSASPAYNSLGALTKTDDANVTLTLGGTPATALAKSVSMTLGWSGLLSVARGGTGVGTLTGVAIGNGTSTFTGVTGTAGQLLRRNAANTAYEFFTPTYLTTPQNLSRANSTVSPNYGHDIYISGGSGINLNAPRIESAPSDWHTIPRNVQGYSYDAGANAPPPIQPYGLTAATYMTWGHTTDYPSAVLAMGANPYSADGDFLWWKKNYDDSTRSPWYQVASREWTTGSFIQNQTATAQTASARISGTFTANGQVQGGNIVSYTGAGPGNDIFAFGEDGTRFQQNTGYWALKTATGASHSMKLGGLTIANSYLNTNPAYGLFVEGQIRNEALTGTGVRIIGAAANGTLQITSETDPVFETHALRQPLKWKGVMNSVDYNDFNAIYEAGVYTCPWGGDWDAYVINKPVGSLTGVNVRALLEVHNENQAGSFVIVQKLSLSTDGTSQIWQRALTHTGAWGNWVNLGGTTYTGSTSITLTSGSFTRAALTGDVTAAANSNSTTIANNVVTYAKMQDIPTKTLIGRGATGTGDPGAVTIGDGLALSTGNVLSANQLTITPTLDFPPISGVGSTSYVDVSMTGAAVGDTVVLGLPIPIGEADLFVRGYVIGTDTVRVRITAITNIIADYPPYVFTIKILK